MAILAAMIAGVIPETMSAVIITSITDVTSLTAHRHQFRDDPYDGAPGTKFCHGKRKKISTPEQAVCHYKGIERGRHSAYRDDYNPKFIGSKLIIGTVDALAGAGKTFHALSG
jgi:hypothetical protein